MTEDGSRDDALDAAHPILRSVGPPDAPYPGLLRRVGDGSARLFVEAEAYGSPPAWTCDPAGHVLAPLDVARRRGGHDIVLAHCVERIEDLLARRAGEDALGDGEAVTLAVSLRRGLAAVLAAGEDPPCRWWLTDDGRPVLACDAEGEAATVATGRIVAALGRGASPALAVALDRLAEAIAHPRALARDAAEIEDALFAVAAPAPIERERAARRSSLADLLPSTTTAAEAPPDRWEEVLRGHLDGDLADLTAAAVRSVRDRLASRRRRGVPRRRPSGGADAPRGERTRRPRPWLVAACLAVAVVGAGLLWPSSGDPATAEGSSAAPRTEQAGETTDPPASPGAPTEEEAAVASEGPGAAAAPSGVPPDPAPSGAAGDPVSAAALLLAAARVCGDDPACATSLVEDAAASTAERLSAIADAGGEPELVDDFGGAAVVRVAHDGGTSLVVVVQETATAAGPEGAGWLVRDVYDVADQP